MTNKKLTKKVCKFEKKHPNLTACCVYITGASLALRAIGTIVGIATAAKTINNIRDSANEVLNDLFEENNKAEDPNIIDINVNDLK